MRFYLFALLLLAAPAFASWTHAYTYNQRAAPAVTIPLAGATATVAFSPNGDGTRIIVKAIRQAKHRILVQAYGFTSRPIERALVQAEKRGVVVEAVFDKSTFSERYSEADVGALMEHGVPMWEDWSPAIAHNKVMVIDGGTVITGSFNFTKAAQKDNAENVIIITGSPALAHVYATDWRWRRGLSIPFDDQAKAWKTGRR